MDDREPTGVGRVVQGGVTATVRRGLRSQAELELVAARAVIRAAVSRAAGWQPALGTGQVGA